jgi:hypothetical protein
VRYGRAARCEEAYFKAGLLTVHKATKTFLRALPGARTLSLRGLNMSLGLTVEVNPREEARQNKTQSGQPVPTKVSQNLSSSPSSVDLSVCSRNPPQRPPVQGCCATWRLRKGLPLHSCFRQVLPLACPQPSKSTWEHLKPSVPQPLNKVTF